MSGVPGAGEGSGNVQRSRGRGRARTPGSGEVSSAETPSPGVAAAIASRPSPAGTPTTAEPPVRSFGGRQRERATAPVAVIPTAAAQPTPAESVQVASGRSTEGAAAAAGGPGPARGPGGRRGPAEGGATGPAKRGSPPSGESPEGAMVDLLALAKRPGYGTLGRKYRIFANHFEVGINKKLLTVSQYHIDISHERIKLTRDDNRPIFWKCMNQNRETLGLSAPDALYSIAYDGVHLCYSLDYMNVPQEKNNDSRKFKVDHVVAKADRVVTLDVTIQSSGPLVVDFSQVMNPNLSDRTMTPIQVIDIILRQYRSQPFLESAKLYYPFRNSVFMVPGQGNTTAGYDLGGGREVWKGLFTSAHVVEGHKPLVNMDVDHTAFYKYYKVGPNGGGGRNGANGAGNVNYSVINYLCDVLNETERKQIYFADQMSPSTAIPESQKTIFEREIKGLRVCIDYKKEKSVNDSREYRVFSLDKSAADCEFKDREGKMVKVAEYYRETYGPLKFPRLFCLNVGNKDRPIFLPAEHCYLSKCQKVTKKLTEAQTAAMIKQTCMAPPARKGAIEQVVAMARFNEDPFLRKFGISVNPNMMGIESRRLPDPALLYANPIPVAPRDGVWKTQGQRFHKPAGTEFVGVIAFGRVPQNTNMFVENLLGTCRQYGMKMPNLSQCCFHLENNTSAQRAEIAVKSVIEKMKNVKLIIVILPFKGTALYGEIKRASEVQLGIMTQCVVQKTLEKASPDTLSNIALKINMKLGGINCSLSAREVALKYLCDPKSPTLVLGIDVTHPGPTEKKKPSIASIVGSVDSTHMRFAASIKVQAKRDEHLVYLADKVTERLMAFYKNTQRKPERIIVYRDGVSEGQFQQVLREELRGVREACSKVDAGYRPKITFIVVQKRHHTRFFPADMNDGCGKAKNVYPGTAVDNRIVHPDEFVFYLCSHAGIQGTSRPTRYYVLHDDSNFSADDVQLMTYFLCHCYSRCTRAVSIPAPVYYADLACTRARSHLTAALGDSLSDTTSTYSGGEAGSSSSPKEDELIAATTVMEHIRREMYFT